MNNIICPYCDYEFEDDEYYENKPNEDYELECPNCQKIMLCSYELHPYFNTNIAPCLNGEEHEYVKIIGAPKEFFEYKRRCKYCDKEIITDEEKHKKTIENYFKELDKK